MTPFTRDHRLADATLELPAETIAVLIMLRREPGAVRRIAEAVAEEAEKLPRLAGEPAIVALRARLAEGRDG